MNKQQSGFTLIELVMVIVILGILAASFAPRFVDLSTDAETASAAAALGATKSAITIELARNRGTFPSLTALAAAVDGAAVAADNTGVVFDVDGDSGTSYGAGVDGREHRVAAFTDASCTTAASAGADLIQCVQ